MFDVFRLVILNELVILTFRTFILTEYLAESKSF